MRVAHLNRSCFRESVCVQLLHSFDEVHFEPWHLSFVADLWQQIKVRVGKKYLVRSDGAPKIKHLCACTGNCHFL